MNYRTVAILTVAITLALATPSNANTDEPKYAPHHAYPDVFGHEDGTWQCTPTVDGTSPIPYTDFYAPRTVSSAALKFQGDRVVLEYSGWDDADDKLTLAMAALGADVGYESGARVATSKGGQGRKRR